MPKTNSHKKKFDRIRKIDFEEVRCKNLELLNDSVEYIKDACAIFLIDKYDLEPSQVQRLLVRDVEVERIEGLFFLTIHVGDVFYLEKVELPEDYGRAFKFLDTVARGLAVQAGWEPRLEALFSDRTDPFWCQEPIPNQLEHAEELIRNACATYLLDEFANTDSCDFFNRIKGLKWHELNFERDKNGFMISINTTDKQLFIHSNPIKKLAIFGLAIEKLLENACNRTCKCQKKKKKRRNSEELGCLGPCERVFEEIDNLSSYLKKLNSNLLPEDFHIFKATLSAEKTLGCINLKPRIRRVMAGFSKEIDEPNGNHKGYWEKMEEVEKRKYRLKRLRALKQEVRKTKLKRIHELEDELEDIEMRKERVFEGETDNIIMAMKKFRLKIDGGDRTDEEVHLRTDKKVLEIRDELVALRLELEKEKMEVREIKKGIVNRLEEQKVLRKNEKLRRLLQRYPKRSFLSDLVQGAEVTAVKQVFDNTIRNSLFDKDLSPNFEKNNYIDPRVYANWLKRAHVPVEVASIVLASGSLCWAVKEVYDKEEEFKFMKDLEDVVGTGEQDPEIRKEPWTPTIQTSQRAQPPELELSVDIASWESEEAEAFQNPNRWRAPIWDTLIHQGPYFPPYHPLPLGIRFIYNGIPMTLSRWAEEGAVLYAKHANSLKKMRHKMNFFVSWRQWMTEEEKRVIVDFDKCDFSMLMKNPELWSRKDENEETHRYAMVDDVRREIPEYRIEASRISMGSSLPKGTLIKRITANDIVINCSEHMVPTAPEGEQWKQVLHDRTLDLVWKLPDAKTRKERQVRWRDVQEEPETIQTPMTVGEEFKIKTGIAINTRPVQPAPQFWSSSFHAKEDVIASVQLEPEPEPKEDSMRQENLEPEPSYSGSSSLANRNNELTANDIVINCSEPVAPKSRAVRNELPETKKGEKTPERRRDVEEELEQETKAFEKELDAEARVVAPTIQTAQRAQPPELELLVDFASSEEAEAFQNPNRWRAPIWDTLIHQGPYFPPYRPLPLGIRFIYNGIPMTLSRWAEEGAVLYVKNFKKVKAASLKMSFFVSWRQWMTDEEKRVIVDFDKCDFSMLLMSPETLAKSPKDPEIELHKYAIVDGVRREIPYFHMQPSRIGVSKKSSTVRLIKRTLANDIIINCSENEVPDPPEGEQWKQVLHDKTLDFVWKIGEKAVSWEKDDIAETVSPVWNTLTHLGPYFKMYKRLPPDVRFIYNGAPMDLSLWAEEGAIIYARNVSWPNLKERKCKLNFFASWRTWMTEEEKRVIVDFDKCDFSMLLNNPKCYSGGSNFANPNKQLHKYAMVDGVRRLICNNSIQPSMISNGKFKSPRGSLIRRITASEITINCSENMVPSAPEGEHWKEVLHDRTLDFVWKLPNKMKGGERKPVRWIPNREISEPKIQVKTREVVNKQSEFWTTPIGHWGLFWNTLIHRGPYFPSYHPLPLRVRFIYNGKPMDLSRWAEEGAVLYTKNANSLKKMRHKMNFFASWREWMTEEEKRVIVDFGKCDFSMLMGNPELWSRKDPNEETHRYAMVDGVRREIPEYRIEASSISMGSSLPKGFLIKRITANDIVINCSEHMVPSAPEGEQWKEVLHDRTLDFVWKLPESKRRKDGAVHWERDVGKKANTKKRMH